MNYSGEEIIQIAIGEEKDAMDFYRVALENSNAQETRELFQFLLNEEERHLVELERDILPIFQEASFSWEDEDVIAAYLLQIKGRMGAEILASMVKKASALATDDPQRDKVTRIARAMELNLLPAAPGPPGPAPVQ